MIKAKSFTGTAFIAVALLSMTSCSNLDTTQQRMLSGGAAGAAIGAVGTVVTGGCVACGAAVGAAVGTAGGYLVDKLDNNTKSDGGY